MMTKKNNKGFSFVELIVVIAIIGVAAAITATSFYTVYGARSKAAAKTIYGYITQSKASALSGKRNLLLLAYDENEEKYMCYLVNAARDADGNYIKDSSGNYCYDESVIEYDEDIGNGSLQISVPSGNDTYSLIDEDGECNGILVMDFNMDTGALKSLGVLTGSDNVDDFIESVTLEDGTEGTYMCPDVSSMNCNCLTGNPSSVTITFSSYSNHYVKIYRSTGEVEFS